MFRNSQSKTLPSINDQAAEMTASATKRIKSEELFQKMKEVEIDHEGRIYRLRLTQFNKLILTA